MALFTLFILACLTSPLLHSITATSARSTAAPSRLVDRVCKSTTHRAFCHALLDPFNSTKDPYTVASIAVGFTYYNATSTSTKEYIHLWLRSNENNTEPGTRRGMLDCEGYYKQAIMALKKVYTDLEKRSAKRLGDLATYVEERGLGCKVAFMRPYPVSFMAKKNQNFIYLADICAAVSDLFARPVMN